MGWSASNAIAGNRATRAAGSRASAWSESAKAVASIVWLGYRTPQAPAAVVTRHTAKVGGPALAAALDGLSAVRGTDPARTTVVAHSYGTVVTDHAAAAPGPLPADALVLNGSPGLDRSAADLEVEEVYEASALRDPISLVQHFGNATWDDDFGAVELPTDWSTGHTEYYDLDRPTVAAIGEVVAGVR